MAKKRAAGGGVERAVKFRFNHYCEITGAQGAPGEVKEIPEDMARMLVERRGGEIVGPAGDVDDETEGDDGEPGE